MLAKMFIRVAALGHDDIQEPHLLQGGCLAEGERHLHPGGHGGGRRAPSQKEVHHPRKGVSQEHAGTCFGTVLK